jgi:hypothetical protein
VGFFFVVVVVLSVFIEGHSKEQFCKMVTW